MSKFDYDAFQIVSSFKIPNQTTSIECRRTRNYIGHRDGVWEVSCARHTPSIIGTASAGNLDNIHSHLTPVHWSNSCKFAQSMAACMN